MHYLKQALIGLALAAASPAVAADVDYALQFKQDVATLRDFKFASGEMVKELRVGYATLGTPRRDAAGRVNNAVMILHGTGGSGQQFLSPQFAQQLYGPGQALDIRKYYIILPDGIGYGRSSKPSDGMRSAFPRYDYDDMVEAQRRLLAERLQVGKLRLLMGTSMGCMHGFVWGQKHAASIQAMMPMACLPMRIAGHNRMWRRAAIEGIKQDPAWNGGNYASQPAQGLRTAVSLLQIAGFAPLYLHKAYPDRDAADAYIVDRINMDVATRDANDLIYQLEASRTYDPSARLEAITPPTTWINSSDDFINPWDYGFAETAAKRLPSARFVLIKASVDTRGHSSHTWAQLWKHELVDLLARTEGK